MKLTLRVNLLLTAVFVLALVVVVTVAYRFTADGPLQAVQVQRLVIALVASLAFVFLVLFSVINSVLRKRVLKPVAQVKRMADETAEGNLSLPDIKVTGEDEIADMQRAFNGMRRSMVRIVQISKKLQAKVKAQD